jgi:ABC-2 type transport system ATP-binding protein
MRMKAAFASSLAYRPSLIVLDEPFTGLDPLVRDELIESLLERAAETTIFLSSHDLAEIESFASHVGYLEDGRMLFSEEMTVLSERFREVTITLTAPALLPPNLPSAWLLPETADCVVRFVHSDYRGEASEHEVAAVFPGARDVEWESMPLRSIFLAIAKTGRTQNHAPQIAADDRRVEA